jgi:hypothetical protein
MGFGHSGRYEVLPRRFKKTVYSIDSSTVTLVANCMDWAAFHRGFCAFAGGNVRFPRDIW